MATNTTGGERLYNIMQCDLYNFKLIIIFYEDIGCSLRNLNIVETWNDLTLTLKVTEVFLFVCLFWVVTSADPPPTLLWQAQRLRMVPLQELCKPKETVCPAEQSVTSTFSDDTSDVPLGLTHILISVLILPHIQHITQHVWSMHPLF